MYNLTQQERNLIIQALDFYGNKIADTQGYSSGVPYWNLKDKMSTNTITRDSMMVK